MTPDLGIPTRPSPPSGTADPSQQDRAAALAAIWNRHLPSTRERLAQLDRAASLATDGRLTAPLRTDAAMAAHKLAGSLGTFGYHEGTRIARAIEQLLAAPAPPHAPHLLRLTEDLRSALPL